MKKTFLIKKGSHLEVLRTLILDFGYPKYFSELVIYFKNTINLKIVLTRNGFQWSWRDPALKPDKYMESSDVIRTNLRNLLEKFHFLASHFGNRGSISIAPTLVFYDKANDMQIEVRPKSMIGEIVTLRTEKTHKDCKFMDDFHDKYVKKFYGGDWTKKVKSLKTKNTTEEFVRYGIGKNPILGTKILDFCKENGIMNPFRGEKTFRELVDSKSNDYKYYEELFNELTGMELLARDKHIDLPKKMEHKISVIIPYFNSNDTINKALLSLKYQNISSSILKQNLEVIIIDDNSKFPASNFINVNEYPFRIEIIRFSHNYGVSHARQIGVTHSTGDILVFMDSDIILSKDYLKDHLIRNIIINNGVFISFKENVDINDSRIAKNSILNGVSLPNYQDDLRISKKLNQYSIGYYEIKNEMEINILEETNYLKDFYGSRKFGTIDLNCMTIGHNFSVKRDLVLKSSPFNKIFRGWGMEDTYFGMKMLTHGNFIIPVISSGVYHINHPPRSGSKKKKEEEYRKNVEIMKSILDSKVI